MGTREILLILISFFLGLWCIHRIRLLDRYEQEPFGKMVLVTALGGGFAVIFALGLYEIIERLGFHDFQSALGALLIIGPVEEMAKLIGVLAVFGIIRNELNEPADGIVYMACVALGFSLIENVIYASYPAHEHLIFIRLLVATPLHICFSALMGLSFYIWFKNRQAFHLIVTAYLLASFSHGLYDLVVFNYYSVLLLGATIVLIYGFTRDLFLYAIAVSPHRISLAQTIASAGAVEIKGSTACLHCGGTDAKPTYAIGRSLLQHCTSCGHYNVTLKGLFRLFYHFAGIVRQTAKKHLKSTEGKEGLMTLYQSSLICPKRKMASFRLSDLDALLEKLNYTLKVEMKSRWYLPDNLYRMDQPGVKIDYPKMIRDAGAAFWRALLFPLSPKRRPIHRLPGGGPLWHWSAFFLPELWYALHRLWGVSVSMAGIYLLAVYTAMAVGFSLLMTLVVTALLIRIASGIGGSRIYYLRHGKWP